MSNSKVQVDTWLGAIAWASIKRRFRARIAAVVTAVRKHPIGEISKFKECLALMNL